MSNFSIYEFYDLGLEIFENVVVESVVFILKKPIALNLKTKIKSIKLN